MFTDTGIFIFITACTVKSAKTVCVLREVGRNPVKDNADALFMTSVHKIHKVFRLTVTGCCGKVACNLIAPAAVKRIFCKRHKLNVSVAHILNIRNKFISKLAIAENIAVLILTPRTCVYLINIDRHILVRMLFFVVIPLFIMPLVAVNLVNTRCVVGTSLAMKSIRICFKLSLMPRSFDTIFIAGKLRNSLNKQLPDAAVRDFVHKVCVIVPVVKITDHRNGQCVRRPNSEHNALTAVPVHKV